MPTVYTQRRIIVVKTALRATANQYALVADPEAGDNTFRVGLRLASDTANQAVVAYWTGWTMTPAQVGLLEGEFGKLPNFKVYARNDNVPAFGQRDYWMFQAATDADWTGALVLGELGLAPVSTPI